jgi:hypothetical protein
MFRRACLVAILACSSPNATFQITTGGETDTMTAPPPVDSVILSAVDNTGVSTPLQSSPSPYDPATTIDLGNPSQEAIVSIQFTGTAAGTPVVTGATPFAQLGALTGTVPLFVQRRGECARITSPTGTPGPFADGRSGALLAATGRMVYAVGGTTGGDAGILPFVGYDMLGLQNSSSTLPVAQQPQSFALVQLLNETADGDLAVAWLISADAGVELGLSTQEDYWPDASAPPNTMVTWADIAGGATVMGDDGPPPTAYIVGGTAISSYSNFIVALSPAGVGSHGNGARRQWAAATLTKTHQVFIYGGNGDTSAGAELVAPFGTDESGNPLPLTVSPLLGTPADATQGLAAAPLDNNTMVMAGNADAHTNNTASDGGAAMPWGNPLQPFQVTLSCSSQSCDPTPWGVAIPMALIGSTTSPSSPSLFPVGSGEFILVGDDSSGNTHVYLLTSTATTEMQLKIPRQGARAVQFSTGQVIIVGGGTTTVESCVAP